MARIDSIVPYENKSPWKNPWVLVGGGALLWLVYARFSSRKKDLTGDVVATQSISGQVIDPIKTIILDSYAREAFTRALPAAGKQYANLFVQTAASRNVSPFILAGIAERETGYGAAGVCKSTGPACIGSPNVANPDYGLMQINKKNLAAYGVSQTWAQPAANIDAGARILNDTLAYFKLAGGQTTTVSAGNAAKFGVLPGKYPDPRPMSGLPLWQAGIAGYNAGQGNVVQALAAGRSADAATTGKDYGADVLRRATRIAKETARQLGAA
jgi:hypothetical protein